MGHTTGAVGAKRFWYAQIGIITAVYPAVWGLGQWITGKLADIYCKKDLLFWGMLLQGIAIILIIFSSSITHYIGISIILGIGTAIVYPTFLASIAEDTNPQQRAKSFGVFRFWRDLGYIIGALLTGVFTDFFSIEFLIALLVCLLSFHQSLLFTECIASPKQKGFLKNTKSLLLNNNGNAVLV